MFVRRRPLLRAAAVGGGAYVAGKKAAQRSAQQAGLAAEQQERISSLERERPVAGGPGAGTGVAEGGSSMASQLQQISALHDQGVLTDEEFATAKARLIGR